MEERPTSALKAAPTFQNKKITGEIAQNAKSCWKYEKLPKSCLATCSEGVGTKHGPGVHGPPTLDRVHGPLSWTRSMDPLSWTGSMDTFFLNNEKLTKTEIVQK